MNQLTWLFLAVGIMIPAFGGSGGAGLLAGMAFALTIGNPAVAQTRRWTPMFLQVSVIGLGAAVNLATVASVGLQGAAYTAIGITLTAVLGWIIGRMFGTERTTSTLLSVGTAICGGSAIAAVAPVIRAKDQEISVSLATVFFLNAAALFLFPWIGHGFGMSQEQFGLWSALAIHDTSSVVGASMQFGPRALEIATTIKLARALWIVPMTLAIGFLWARSSGGVTQAGEAKSKKPWFILGFIAMSAIVTWLPALQPAGRLVAEVAKKSLVLTLFLIGSGLSRATLQSVGFKPFAHGTLLWVIVGGSSLALILAGLIH